MSYIYAMECYSAVSTYSTDVCYNMDESLKQYAQLKNPETKEHAFYYSIYMKCPEEANLKRQKMD